jgi:hypothetical protein
VSTLSLLPLLSFLNRLLLFGWMAELLAAADPLLLLRGMLLLLAAYAFVLASHCRCTSVSCCRDVAAYAVAFHRSRSDGWSAATA